MDNLCFGSNFKRVGSGRASNLKPKTNQICESQTADSLWRTKKSSQKTTYVRRSKQLKIPLCNLLNNISSAKQGSSSSPNERRRLSFIPGDVLKFSHGIWTWIFFSRKNSPEKFARRMKWKSVFSDEATWMNCEMFQKRRFYIWFKIQIFNRN